MKKKDPLGKGLSAILNDIEDRGAPLSVPLSQIRPNPNQPRLSFKDESITELAESIKEKGLLQPILVRKAEHGYEIIAGERRFRASIKAGLDEVPVIVKDADDKESLEMALIENLQREDLNSIDVARVYRRFVEDFDYTHDGLAKKIGVERSSVTNYIRLLKLPVWIQELIVEGKLTQGHGRVLITIEDEVEQKRYVERVLKEAISVRSLENIRRQKGTAKSSPFGYAEDLLREALKTKVQITFKKDKGKLIIEFYSKDDLEGLLELLAPEGQ
jgi:ParB family transcriptional regulator, chromosome partitioning protein